MRSSYECHNTWYDRKTPPIIIRGIFMRHQFFIEIILPRISVYLFPHSPTPKAAGPYRWC